MAYVPNPIGPVKLTSRSTSRSRLEHAGTFFRSYERGEQANLIKIGVFEDGSDGVCVVQHTMLKPSEQIFAQGTLVPEIQLLKLNLEWNQELQIKHDGAEWRAIITGISRQIVFEGPGEWAAPISSADLGAVTDGTFTSEHVAFKVQGVGTWPLDEVVYLRPRTRRYTLVLLEDTDPDTMEVSIGWDPEVLRDTLNGDAAGFVSMPARGVLGAPGDDAQDTGKDDTFITSAPMKSMKGGNGLPATPVGLNTGPAKVLVHLNYAERDDGSMGELNQIFEWVGDSATSGSWQRRVTDGAPST